MPPSLRSRGPLCHYCNRWSSSKNKGSRRFRCENCLAENFLDENGEILDVPAEETSSPQRLAQPFAQPLPNHQSVESTVNFCATCLKNQHLLTETLSNYLPAPDHSNYDRFETSYPEYRRKLEERYPPVCARCEPGVRQQIQQAGYAAKSDHLRRMVERSRRRTIANRWGWRSLVVTLGKVLFWASIMGQLVWNVIGVREDSARVVADMESSMILRSVQCAAQLPTGLTDSGCAVSFAPIAQVAVLLGLLSSWWNPKWQHKLQGRDGRLAGLRDYYLVNVAMLLFRIGFWTFARDLTMTDPTDYKPKVAHGFAMVVTLMLTFYTMTRVEIDTTPLVSWQDNPIQLLSPQQYNPPVQSRTVEPPLSSRGSRLEASNFQAFPIGSLAPQPQRQIWQAPTPPPDEDPDAMEWEPSQNFQPNPRLPRAKPPSGPAPFHGALPVKPTNRLLHPQPERQTLQKEAIGLPPGFFDKRDRLTGQKDSSQLPPMSQPKFFSQGDWDADTGLEGIFSSVFSLGDAPTVSVQKTGSTMLSTKEPQLQDFSGLDPSSAVKPWYGSVQLNVLHTAKFAVFVVGWLVLYAAHELQLCAPHVRGYTVSIAGSVQLCSALSEMMRLNLVSDVSDIVWSGLMAAGSVVFMLKSWSKGDEEAFQDDNRLAMILLFVCSCWEIPRLLHWDPHSASKIKVRPDVQGNRFREVPNHNPEEREVVDGQPHGPAAVKESWRPISSKDLPPISHGSRRQPEQVAPLKYRVPLQASGRRPNYRTRSDSTDSTASESSVATTTTATTAGWKTPNFREQNLAGIAGPSPSFNLRSLALNDAAATPRRQEQNGHGTRSGKKF